MSILVISTSLNAQSRSRRLAAHAMQLLTKSQVPSEFVDLVDLGLPICDGDAAYAHPSVGSLKNTITSASGILIAFPIYNFTAAASAKNLIELVGPAFEKKVVGLMCAAGGPRSYMAPMSLANQMMLDFRCLIVPRFIYATDSAFDAQGITDESITTRIQELIDDTVRIASALSVPE